MIKAVIIDDELDSIETLEWKIKEYCPDVSVIKSFNDPVKALGFLKKNTIDVLFLDIEMPRLNGFDVLQSLEEVTFDVIFTTAYDEFGIQAIKFSALDYLLKPVQINDLQTAINKYQNKNEGYSINQKQIDLLLTNIQREKIGKPSLIALATKESIEYVHPDDIVVCCSDSNYTMIHFTDGRKKLIARTLKEFDLMLSTYNFFRPHNSYLVNLAKVKQFIRSDGGYLILKNEMKIPVSKSKREDFLKLMG